MSSLATVTGQDQYGTNLNCAYVSTSSGVETWKFWGHVDGVNDATLEDDNGTLRYTDMWSSSPARYTVSSSSAQPGSYGPVVSSVLIPDGYYLHGWTSTGSTYKGYVQVTYLTPTALPSIDSTSTWHGTNQTYEFRWRSSATGKEIYDLWWRDPQSDGSEGSLAQWASTAGVHSIEVDTATDVWSDNGTGDPVTLSLSAGVITLSKTSDPNLYKFTKPTTAYWSGSGSGSGGGGIAPLGGAPVPPVIMNVAFTKNSADDELTLTFDWDENDGSFASFHIYKQKASDPLNPVSVTASPGSGSSGTVSMNSSDKVILGNVDDGDKFWIRNNPSYTNNVPDDPLDIVDGFGGIGRPYTHRYIDWSIGIVNGVKSVIAKYYGFNTGFADDHLMNALGTSVNLQGVEHSYTGSELTKSLQYKTGRNRYWISKAVPHGSGSAWEDYGSSFLVQSGKVSSNFW